MEYKLNCAQLRQMAPRLHAGDRVLLSGRVYTSRDAAHKRIVAAMDAGEPLPQSYATRLCICVPLAAPVRWLPSALRPAK